MSPDKKTSLVAALLAGVAMGVAAGALQERAQVRRMEEDEREAHLLSSASGKTEPNGSSSSIRAWAASSTQRRKCRKSSSLSTIASLGFFSGEGYRA